MGDGEQFDPRLALSIHPVPEGQFDSDQVLNIGTDRWSSKPEFGVSKAWGAVILELIPAITFFTDNDFLDGKPLEQDPIYSVQGHLIYEFAPAFWAAFNATYCTGGRTTIGGERAEQRPENVRPGVTTALSLSRHHSIKLYGSTGVFSRTDSDFWAVGLAWQYRWGGGL